MTSKTTVLAILLLSLTTITFAEVPDATWIERSDRDSRLLLEVFARFNPEGAGAMGIEGLEHEILQLPVDRTQRRIEVLEAAVSELRARLLDESDPRVQLDLEILIDSTMLNIDRIRLEREHFLPYVNVARIVFQGLRSLLDDQSTPEQVAAAGTRLRRYAGLEPGYPPLSQQAEAIMEDRIPLVHLVGPYVAEVEQDLESADRYLGGIRDLLATFEIEGCDRAVDALELQINAYNEFIRTELLPRCRRDFHLPTDIYANLLESMGVDMSVRELSSRARVAFREIQNEMQVIASLIAGQRELPSADYRDVIRVLKRDQLVGEEILTTYEGRIRELEAIIEQHEIVSLPKRGMRIRLASEAESASIPSPFMLPPRIIGNTGEVGEFVLPFRSEAGSDSADTVVDDYTFDAASWTLAVHEGRPGHELQFTAMIENGVSLARSIFAFNSVNVEGWALYCEAEVKPYFPLEGQLISLQQRLLRAARAFLDPGMQSGEISGQEALRLLERDVVLSAALARQEVERYTFGDPAQATSYFCGYLRLMELRAMAEQKMGDAFDRKAFHDLVLDQGMLPPRLLAKAVLDGLS